MEIENIIHFFFKMTNTVKLYHWSTLKYPRHIASDQLVTGILPLIDQFVEVYIGRYSTRPRPRPPNPNNSIKIKIDSYNDADIIGAIENYILFLERRIPEYTTDTELLNIRDEMLSILNKTLYLFTFE